MSWWSSTRDPSTTNAIARSFGGKVFDFPWCDDFAAARNETLSHASGARTFWMDADDRLDGMNRSRLKSLLGQLDPATAYVMAIASRDACGPTSGRGVEQTPTRSVSEAKHAISSLTLRVGVDYQLNFRTRPRTPLATG